MITKTEQNLQQFYARLAGFSYILFTVAGFVKNFLLDTRLSDISTAQVNSLFENEMHFRLGILAEAIMFLGVVMASMSFYLVLKSVNKPLAQTALCLRLVEIIIGSIGAVISMAMLALSNKTYLIEMFDLQQLHNIIVIAASFSLPAYEYSWIFMGFAGIITFYLFYKMHFIPRAWSVWGMITYSSLIVYPVAKLLIADLPREAMFVLFPGALFELGVGVWLLTMGIKIPNDGANMPDK
ncbi:DUF4386 domain-containing protein [Pseudoalteromonas denitrificans]|jgi:hypothetical protein|uniref:DUF4386 domain-containing protein n=1 Tax=Pseudoalteromonas denitrificans DSM 6059 TaxID=1123010 RepID=A0A1I1KEB3_9GAMM|nr:DUF4386 domain-containing protein [Pseudoalteromonas denitrificans]SFC56453.1 protein of unknown function [Pseudoalteromonas denitrificans DSM 6059]